MALKYLSQEKVWLDKARFADAERVFHEKLSKICENKSSVICSKKRKHSEINAILKNVLNNGDVCANVLKEKSPDEEIKIEGKFIVQKGLADIFESESIEKNKFKKIKVSIPEPRNINECDNFSLCDQVTQYHQYNNINQLLSSIEQWDINISNQYKSITKFECLICYYKTDKFDDWKFHIISISHLSDCHKVKDLYSYVCFNKECKVLLYGSIKLLVEHRTKHLENGSIIGVPSLMAEVMRRFITKQNGIIYFCSHCKKYEEQPIHSDTEKSNIKIKHPVNYYCKYCRVDFYSSPEMIDYHSLSVEHVTLKCFDKLCLEAKINSKMIKKSKQSNENKKNLLPTVENEITANSTPSPNVVKDTSSFIDSNCIENTNKVMQTVQVNKIVTNVDVGSTILLDQKSQIKPLNNSLEKCNINIHNISSESYKSKPSYKNKCERYTRYFKHKMDLLNLLRQYKDYLIKTLIYYCNLCDFVTEEKYIWDKHIKTKHSCTTNKSASTVHCSICSMVILGGTYEEHTRTIEHCILFEFGLTSKPMINDLVKNTELIKSANTSILDETLVDSEQNKPLLNKMNSAESVTLDNPNFENNDCVLRIESNSKSKNLTIINTSSSEKNYNPNKYIKSDEILSIVNSKTTPNKIIDGKLELDVASICGEITSDNVKNHENDKTNELDEDKLYGEYVTQRLQHIKNSTVKLDLMLEIDYLFYTKIKKLQQQNVQC